MPRKPAFLETFPSMRAAGKARAVRHFPADAGVSDSRRRMVVGPPSCTAEKPRRSRSIHGKQLGAIQRPVLLERGPSAQVRVIAEAIGRRTV